MATKVVMEALSPTMEEGRLVKWSKAEGDQVKTGDVLAEVETDKAIMELVARGDGVLRKQLAKEGDASPVGTLIAVIAGADENIDQIVASAAPAAAATAAPAAPPAQPEQSQGEASAPAQEAAPAAVATAPAPTYQPPPPPPRPAGIRGVTSAPAPTPAGANGRQRSSPLARRLASERGVELSAVRGSGPGGRIVKRDIESAMAAAAARPKPAAAQPVKRLITRDGDFQDIPLTQIRKTIARRLSESLGPVPTFYLTAEFDMGRAAEMRAALKEIGEEYKVSFNDIVIKAVANALSDHPEVNAHWMVDRIRHFNRVHVGMAVAIEEGLITPVIFDADRKTMVEISREAKQLAELARSRRLTPEQYTGSTFSVSNLGMLGIDQFTAIINPPEAGILAIGAVEEKPVVVDGNITVRQRMRVTMSCDHRVIDGATGARFLQSLKRLIENPLLLVL
ncbi:MAG TPA: pyruvate dehydrogenase complex dihydrolipoamide acetyltransferase [Gemmatimonadaceae bacterium]|jgi:pyruvate dehydrogenase E2 component (dihydrolipoamide acetyltransferase)|nr:pyruvate dehydrogenase complex dihydrolipoamide acetyltransferase [Gemmatimonadaceae bacterium]